MILTIVHGDIETREEQESVEALSAALRRQWLGTHGTNDTTQWELRCATLPPDVEAMLDACLVLYPHWRVTRGGRPNIFGPRLP